MTFDRDAKLKTRAESASAKADDAPGWDVRIDSQTGHHLVFPKPLLRLATWLHRKHRNKGDNVMKNTTDVRDLVCGMDVEAATAAGRTDYKGQTYYFCGSKCKEKFDSNPAQYLGKAAETPKSGHGCCS